MSGLVIPGYLVPLLLLKPWSATVVLIEGVITYYIVWFISEYAPRWSLWFSFFGRDRFFALVLVSIIVRLLADVWLLPNLGEYINQKWQLNFDYRNQLHSVGLIIVSLIANQFWKTGFIKGFIPFAVTLSITLLIVRYGLMVFTNFSLSNVGYLYEDIASSILASPKAYIILISTALLASRMNLYYGWDFNGILIPSLLALEWYHPIKIVATVFEAIVILNLSMMFLKLPWLKKMTIEGARKLLLFFNVGFIYKIIIGFVVLAWFPDSKGTDYFGFGYLLSTLMAVKIHDKNIFVRLTRATVQTSLSAVLFSSLVGFSLTQIPISKLFINEPKLIHSEAHLLSDIDKLNGNLSGVLQQEKLKLYEAKFNNFFKTPGAEDIAFFEEGIIGLKAYIENHDIKDLSRAIQALNAINYHVSLIQDRYLYIHETMPLKGWGFYVIDVKSSKKLTVSIPAPNEVPRVFDASVNLFISMTASHLAMAGTSPKNSMATDNVLSAPQSIFTVFHKHFGVENTIQIRGYTQSLARSIAGVQRESDQIDISPVDSKLFLKRSIPKSLDMVKLQQLIGHYAIDWSTPPFVNKQRTIANQDFAELILSPKAIKNLLFKSITLASDIKRVDGDLRIDGYLQEWILDSKDFIGLPGSGSYTPPSLKHLLFMDEEVLTPLLKIIQRYQIHQGWDSALLDDLRVIAQSAAALGYQVTRYHHIDSKNEFLILSEFPGPAARHWGTYVFRLNDWQPFVVNIPRPIYEINSFEFGASLFEKLQAKALLIATAQPFTNFDKSSDLTKLENKINFLNLVNQVLLRETGSQPMIVVNSRAFSYKLDQPIPHSDVLLASHEGVIDMKIDNPLQRQLLNVLERQGLTWELVNGTEQTVGYEVGKNAASMYIKATENKQLVNLWLSPFARARYLQQDENYWQMMQFKILGIESREGDLADFVTSMPQADYSQEKLESLHSILNHYIQEQDVLRLQQLTNELKRHRLTAMRFVDGNGKQAFILINNADDALIAIANLNPNIQHNKMWLEEWPLRAQIKEFIENRSSWMDFTTSVETH